ncbi:MAG TPA: response regulator transcription factor [Streptosporangiaceae bacterium]|jgi:DNA-binding response OmpR family regulator|nr:response regulator transcription factor [Streptosporangiaceae bacterium]
MNVLIVEDDKQIADALEDALTRHGHQTVQASTAAEALTIVHNAQLILLDLELPDLDGHELCRRLRRQIDTPIIVVTGRDDEVDLVMALHLGADDYVVTPFSRHELIARIVAVSRRAFRQAAPKDVPADTPVTLDDDGATTLRLGELQLDLRARRAFVGARQIQLTRKEFDLLSLLMEDSGAVRTREEIITKVWDENWHGSTRTLDVHIGSLRTKLGDTRWIETVRGVGYRVEQPEPITTDVAPAVVVPSVS